MSKRKQDEDKDSSRRFKEKHSLDSDEEEEEKDERLADEDIEGTTIFRKVQKFGCSIINTFAELL